MADADAGAIAQAAKGGGGSPAATMAAWDTAARREERQQRQFHAKNNILSKHYRSIAGYLLYHQRHIVTFDTQLCFSCDLSNCFVQLFAVG